MFYYDRIHGTIYRLDSGSKSILDGFQQLAIAYSYDPQEKEIPYTRHKIGERDWVEKWLNDAKTKYLNHGLNKEASQLHLLYDGMNGNKIPMDLLNKCITHTGGIKYLVKYMESVEVEFKTDREQS